MLAVSAATTTNQWYVAVDVAEPNSMTAFYRDGWGNLRMSEWLQECFERDRAVEGLVAIAVRLESR